LNKTTGNMEKKTYYKVKIGDTQYLNAVYNKK